jgi:hypothetical protein
MAIDIQTETLIDLDEAAKLFPGRDGGTIHPITIGLYTRRGKKGVILESVLAGPRRCTSIQAVARFIEAVTAKAAANGNRPVQPTAIRSRREAVRATRAAVDELVRQGA